jgi:predicted nucleic acid-binding protein
VNVVDSSGWLEYLADAPHAGFFAEAIEDAELLIVPVISVYEVFKVVLRERGEDDALQAVAAMRRGQIVDVDSDLALEAASLGFEMKLPMADSFILATARRHSAVLWTQDEHFAKLEGVRYLPKKKKS